MSKHPPKKKRSYRFFTEESIISNIESRKNKAAELLEQSLSMERSNREDSKEVDRILRTNPSDEDQLRMNEISMAIENRRREIERINMKRGRILRVTLPSLSRTLAAFRTKPMQFLEDDSIVMQP